MKESKQGNRKKRQTKQNYVRRKFKFPEYMLVLFSYMLVLPKKQIKSIS